MCDKLNESLYRNLHVMMRFYEPTNEFRQIVNPYMFIKSNTKAFLHVIHFIFNCLDVAEFNKRFRWPVYDKSGEPHFRKSTVDYMNHLNVIYHLGLETLKMSSVHIPGGFKFIKMIHRFSYLIMNEKVKNPKYGTLPKLNEIPDPNDQLMRLKQFIDEGLKFIEKVDAQSDLISKRIDELNAMMDYFFENHSNKESRCFICLAVECRDELNKVIGTEVKPYLERVNIFNVLSVQLNELLVKLFIERVQNFCQYDKGKLIIAQKNIKKDNLSLVEAVNGMIKDNFINFEYLLKVFEYLLPKIMNKIEKFQFRNFDSLQFENMEINNLNTKALSIVNKLNDIELSLEPFLMKEEENFKEFYIEHNPSSSTTFPFSLIHTPEIIRRSENKGIGNRLALMNGNYSKAIVFKEALPPINRTCQKTKLNKPSFHRLNSLDSSLQILSRRKISLSASINTTNTCRTSTPMPPMNATSRMRNNAPNFSSVLQAPSMHVNHFRQSNNQFSTGSPSRYLRIINRTNSAPRTLSTDFSPIAGNQSENNNNEDDDNPQ